MKTSDLNIKHFSRYGEFLASFELSKYGWNVYTPVYDEYIDLIVQKVICAKCNKSLTINVKRICDSCKQEIFASKKKDIIPLKVCKKCKSEWEGSSITCKKCDSKDISYNPKCPICSKGIVKLVYDHCPCGSLIAVNKFRTIQVKASRIEKKKSFAIDHDPKDIIKTKEHFFIWVCIDEKDKPIFFVMSVEDFERTMGDSLKGTSWLKDDDRQHFPKGHYGKWAPFLNNFKALD